MSYQKSKTVRAGESTQHLQSVPVQQDERTRTWRTAIAVKCALALAASALLMGVYYSLSSRGKQPTTLRGAESNMEKSVWKFPRHDKEKHVQQSTSVVKRCDWVVNIFEERNAGMSKAALRDMYAHQVEDANVFYRATAAIFWLDFATRYRNITLSKNIPSFDKTTWTWVTGDQHLSNFGAWRNRHGTVVYSVNDFDEAAIYDFQIDVLRVAVSICGHADSNNLSDTNRHKALRAFTDTYVQTVLEYVDNEKALTYELTVDTATGALKTFIQKVESDNSRGGELEHYTEVVEGVGRRFIRSEKNVDVTPEVENEIRSAFTSDKYGATMVKTGWHVPRWSDEYFKVLDVTARVGTGVGSYGVDRYYVLLQGSGNTDGKATGAIILDVKYEPTPAVAGVLTSDEVAWYKVLFNNEAARAVEGQRRLTSYVDPFTGWVVIGGKALVVRQRSPWKAAPDLDSLTDPEDFIEFMSQVGKATATSHVRGTVSKSPGQFKQVIADNLGDYMNRRAWGKAIRDASQEYHKQVVLDYHCFKDYVDRHYPMDE